MMFCGDLSVVRCPIKSPTPEDIKLEHYVYRTGLSFKYKFKYKFKYG